MSPQQLYAACTHPSILPPKDLERRAMERSRLEEKRRTTPSAAQRTRLTGQIRDINTILAADANARTQEQTQYEVGNTRTVDHQDGTCGCRGRVATPAERQALIAHVAPQQFLTPTGELITVPLATQGRGQQAYAPRVPHGTTRQRPTMVANALDESFASRWAGLFEHMRPGERAFVAG